MLLTNLIILPLCSYLADAQDYSSHVRNYSLELIHFTNLEVQRVHPNNVVLSPFGIWTLMAAVFVGADGNSYDEIRRTFAFPKSDTTLAKTFDNITNAVLMGDVGVNVTSANFMFLNNDFKLKTGFREYILRNFNAKSEYYDFKKPAEAASSANLLISASTNGSINDVMAASDFTDARMVLTNVLKFKGEWQTPFNKSETKIEPFYNDNGDVIGQVAMMSIRTPLRFSNVKRLQGYVLELPYGSGEKYSFLALLPYQGVTVNSMFKNLEFLPLTTIIDQLSSDEYYFGLDDVDCRIPRFKITTNLLMTKPLNDMGVYEIFDSGYANFARMTDEEVYVSALVHKAEIEVTESGTVAQAVSSATFSNRNSPPEFAANKPFAYFVIEKTTTTVLFGGIYNKPSIY